MFFYSETTQPYTGPKIDIFKMNATEAWLRHFDNLLILSFFHQTGTRLEKQTAAVELAICERKLAYWERHPNFDATAVLKAMPAKKREWHEHPYVTSRIPTSFVRK